MLEAKSVTRRFGAVTAVDDLDLSIATSELLLFELNDPRVQGATITEVDIDRELQHADIKVNALGDETRQAEVLEGLQSAHSFIRKELGRRLKLRKVPQIHFHWDYSLQQVIEVEELLNNLEIPADKPDPAESNLNNEEAA